VKKKKKKKKKIKTFPIKNLEKKDKNYKKNHFPDFIFIFIRDTLLIFMQKGDIRGIICINVVLFRKNLSTRSKPTVHRRHQEVVHTLILRLLHVFNR
jgi:hypothetical protein